MTDAVMSVFRARPVAWVSRASSARIASAVLLVVLGVLLLFPVQSIVREAFTNADGSGLGLDAVREVVKEPGLVRSVRNTAALAVFGGVISTAIGAMLAIAAVLTPAGKRMSRLLRLVPLIPLTVPALVGAMGWLFLLSPRVGWINIGLRNLVGSDAETGPIYASSLPAVIGITCLYVIPFVFTVFSSSLQRLSSDPLEAMLVSGSGAAGALWRTLTGTIRPAMFAAFTLAIVQSMSLFSVALIMQLDVLPTYIYRNVVVLGYPERAAAAAIPLMAIALALTIFQVSFLRKSGRFVTVTGKGALGRKISLGPGIDRGLKALSVGYMLVTGILPVAAVAVVSLLPFWKPRFAMNELSVSQYTVLTENAQVQDGIRNSLVLALTIAALAVALTFILSVFADRLKDPVARVAVLVANLPLGVPVVVLGLGFLLAFIGPPIVLYGSMTLLLVAYLVAFLPITMRNVSPIVQQVGDELEEAARVHGATWRSAVVRVTLPLAMPGLAAAFVLLFIIIFREFPLASFIATPGTNVISIALLNFYSSGRWPSAAVISVAICAVSMGGIWLSSVLDRLIKIRS